MIRKIKKLYNDYTHSKYGFYPVLAVVLLLGIWIGSFFAGERIEYQEKIVTIVQHDTTVVVVEKEIVKYIKVNVPEPYEVIVYKDNPDISTRLYRADSTVEEGLVIGYDATVQGYLVDMNLSYEDTRPEVIKYITKEIHTNETNYITPRGIYVGGSLSLPMPLSRISYIDVGPSVDFLINKNILSYSYMVVNRIHMIGYKRKLF